MTRRAHRLVGDRAAFLISLINMPSARSVLDGRQALVRRGVGGRGGVQRRNTDIRRSTCRCVASVVDRRVDIEPVAPLRRAAPLRADGAAFSGTKSTSRWTARQITVAAIGVDRWATASSRRGSRRRPARPSRRPPPSSERLRREKPSLTTSRNPSSRPMSMTMTFYAAPDGCRHETRRGPGRQEPGQAAASHLRRRRCRWTRRERSPGRPTGAMGRRSLSRACGGRAGTRPAKRRNDAML